MTEVKLRLFDRWFMRLDLKDKALIFMLHQAGYFSNMKTNISMQTEKYKATYDLDGVKRDDK